MPRSRPKRDYASRGAYIDHLNRWVWTVDSHGHKSPLREIEFGEDAESIATEMETALDTTDPIPHGAFIPPTPSLRHLRLLS